MAEAKGEEKDRAAVQDSRHRGAEDDEEDGIYEGDAQVCESGRQAGVATGKGIGKRTKEAREKRETMGSGGEEWAGMGIDGGGAIATGTWDGRRAIKRSQRRGGGA